MSNVNNAIFIVGCGHSGTTILNKIMGNHFNIYGIVYETGLFIHNKDTNIIRYKLSILDNERRISNKKWLCEKTPGHIYHISTMHKFINSPKIIIVIRDGRDVVASLKQRYEDLDKGINRWINDNLEWINSPYKQYLHVVKYEDLVQSPKEILYHICMYINEPYDVNMLNYPRQAIILPLNIKKNLTNLKNHNLLRQYQINQELYDGSGRYKQDLTAKELDYLYQHKDFVDIMRFCDY